MTNTEAIKILNECRDRGFERTTYTIEEYHTARDMAIEALQEQAEMDKFEFAEIDPHQTDMDDAWEQAKAELIQNCDQCEVGNSCLYCEHEFKAKADRNEFYNWDAPIRHKADGDLISRTSVLDVLKIYKVNLTVIDIIRGLPITNVTIPNKEGHWEVMYEPKNMVVCSKCGKCAYLYNNRGSAYCPHCGDYKGGKLNG